MGLRCIPSLRHRLAQRARLLTELPGLGITEISEDDLWESPSDLSTLHQHWQGIRVYRASKDFFTQAYEPSGQLLGDRDRETRDWFSQATSSEQHHAGIFAAGILQNGSYYRADYLNLERDGTWTLTLIKSGVRLKERYVLEADWIIRGFSQIGIYIHLVRVFHPDKEYQRTEQFDPRAFLTSESLTSRVKHLVKSSAQLEKRVIEDLQHYPTNRPCAQSQFCGYCKNYFSGSEFPAGGQGGSGDATPPPHDIETAPVGGIEPDTLSLADPDIKNLYRAGGVVRLLREQGIKSILQLHKAQGEARRLLKPRHWIQYEAYTAGKAYIDAQTLSNFINGLRFPLYCLDFESIHQAVPPYAGIHPWEHMPFAYSICRVDDNASLKITWSEVFIATPGQDGRWEMAQRLIQGMGGDQGSIMVYGQEFECFVLRRLAAVFPDLVDPLMGLHDRIADLQKPFQDFAYYNPLQGGKISLKNVLPLFSEDLAYKELEVQNGAEASLGYYFLAYPDQAPKDPQLRRDFGLEDAKDFLPKLEKYSQLDTQGLITILDALRACVRG